MKEGHIRGVVQEIVKGKHGNYVVVTPDPKVGKIRGSITFSLNNPCWKEQDLPEKGVLVVLSQLRMKKAGWRAKRARFYEPEDDK